MRIIGGVLGGRKLNPPTKIPARPTTDLAKEALFNILQNLVDFEASDVLELFAGTGSIGLEFASRGATSVTLVEKDATCCKFIKNTASDFKLSQMQVIQSDALKFISSVNSSFDCIFVDPPYALPQMDIIPDLIFEHQLLKEDGILILEHSTKNHFDKHPKCFKVKQYGTTIFSFFQSMI